MGMTFSKKRCLAFILLFVLMTNLSSLTTSSVNEVQVEDLSMYIPNSEPRGKYDKPVLIRGLWHHVNITLNSEIGEVTIVFYFDETPLGADDRNETNYYMWKYDQGSWKDVQHNSKYINESYCRYDAEFYSFYIGIDQYANLGNWTLKLLAYDEQLLSQQIYVDNAVSSIVLKSIPVVIEVEPFTEDYYISTEKFTVENKGNLPLRLSVSYGKYENIFSTIDFIEILKPNEMRKYSIMLQSRSTWKPGILTIKAEEASVRGHVQNIIPPKEIVYLIGSNVSNGLPINIYVGRSGFALESLAGDITFQYVESLNIYYNDIKDILAYISGNGDVTVNITGKNLDIIKIFSGGSESAVPFMVKSMNTSEHPIAVRVRGIMPNSIALLQYILEIDGEIKKFTTQIHVGSFRQVDETTINITLIVVIIIFIAVVCLIYAQIKHRKK